MSCGRPVHILRSGDPIFGRKDHPWRGYDETALFPGYIACVQSRTGERHWGVVLM